MQCSGVIGSHRAWEQASWDWTLSLLWAVCGPPGCDPETQLPALFLASLWPLDIPPNPAAQLALAATRHQLECVGLWSQSVWVWTLALLLISCVASGKLLNLSVLLRPHPSSGRDSRTYLPWLWESNEFTSGKCLYQYLAHSKNS